VGVATATSAGASTTPGTSTSRAATPGTSTSRAATPGTEGVGFPLSEPGRVSRWAYVERPTAVRSRPRLRARVVTRLRVMTPEGTPELVSLLERRAVAGRLWVRVRLPILPNGTTGWVRREALGGYETVRTHLVVDRRRLRLRLVRSGRTVFRARIGIGAPRWPTPAGKFYVRSRLRGFQAPVYGPLAFGLNARSPVLTDWPGGGFIGIHGTNEPARIPGRPSHGCIRLRNRDILRLGRLMPVGTPVTVR